MDLTPRIRSFRCSCGRPFTVELIDTLWNQFPDYPGAPGIKQGTCSECSEAVVTTGKTAKARGEAEAREKARRLAWEQACPREFRTIAENGCTDEEQLRAGTYQTVDPCGGVATYEALVEFGVRSPVSRPVLHLVGTPGTRKTRLTWRIIRRAFDLAVRPEDPPVVFFTCWQFQAAAQDASGRFVARAWMEALTRAQVVAIDDLGKCEWTDNTSAAFFELLDQRIAHGRPTVITSNMAGHDLRAWMQGSRSGTLSAATESILRRLRQHGQILICL